MTQAEFVSWGEFYKLSPFDDLHRFHRPAALVSVSLAGSGDINHQLDQRLEWLQPRNDGMSDADRNTLQAFGYRK